MDTKDIQTLKSKVQRLYDQGNAKRAMDTIFDNFDDTDIENILDDMDYQSYDSVRDTLLDYLKDCADSYDVDGAEDAVENIRKIEDSDVEFFDAASGEFDPMEDEDMMNLIDDLADLDD